MKRGRSAQVALCGLLGALAVVIMLLGGIIPVATYCCPMLAALLMVPVLYECGGKMALAWYGAVALLSCLFAPDKEAAAVYVFLGWYPIIRSRLGGLPGFLRTAIKLLIFNTAVCALYALLLFVLKADAIREEFFGMGTALLVILFVLGNVTFFMFDLLLPRMELLYQLRLRRRIWKGN